MLRAGALAPLLILLLSPSAEALTPPPGGECFVVPSTILQVTLEQTRICTAFSIVQYPDVPGATLYEIRYTHVASGIRTFVRDGPPFGTPVLGQTAPAKSLWTSLTGNAGLTCAAAIAAAADDYANPEVEVWLWL